MTCGLPMIAIKKSQLRVLTVRSLPPGLPIQKRHKCSRFQTYNHDKYIRLCRTMMVAWLMQIHEYGLWWHIRRCWRRKWGMFWNGILSTQCATCKFWLAQYITECQYLSAFWLLLVENISLLWYCWISMWMSLHEKLKV